MTFPVRHISVSINADRAKVYEYVSNPENLPHWALGLSGPIKKVNEDWISDSPMGKIKIKFAEPNTLGVLDHDVTIETGATFHNPMRVLPNDTGSEIMFTLYQRPEMSEQDFEKDALQIERDFDRLKNILEKNSY